MDNPKTGMYIYVENQDGTVTGNGLYWNLKEDEARIEANCLKAANPKLVCRFVANGKEIFKI